MTRTPDLDVIILGTGVAGLTAAIAAHDGGASVGLFEKSELIGGTTAMSGGIIWMPNNHLQAEAGVQDSREQALAYLDALSLDLIDSDMAAAFVDEGPRALQYVHENTPCDFSLLASYPDYHPEHAGGLPEGGRSVDNRVFPYPSLGEWAGKIRNQRGAMPVALGETPLGGATSAPDPELIGARIANGENGMGLALVGGLLRGCLDRGIEPHLGWRATDLLQDETGRVTGVRFSTPDGSVEQSAATGVIVATGGFEFNPELAKSFLRGPMSGPAGSPENTGDGLTMSIEAGARLANMGNAWWVPVTRVEGEEQFGAPKVHLILLERTRPGSLIVNRTGRRFCNEAGNYNAMGGVFHQFDPVSFDYPNLPAWLIFDHHHKLKYDVASAPAGPDAPEWMAAADSVEELAVAIGVDPATLADTVNRFNDNARAGSDPDFGRGDSAYDTFNGDQTLPGIQATLGPLDQGPFYAISIEQGSLGTNGGPKTDARSRVLAQRGGVINGLWAAGNVMAAPTGMVYGGAGGTIGPALTFGFIAGRDAATL
jgi:succinate dehydrogenase/fumarate reductase flavoprotein subunit